VSRFFRRRAAASGGRRATLVLALLLVAATAAVYFPVTGYQFVEFDDNHYVTANPRVRSGLTGEGIAWAFTSVGYASNWHPLAWLSHMLDAELFGLAAGGHHLTSLLLHLASTVLLFLFLARATGTRRPAALVAALFALHPLHVESVAWVAERKDVLSALLWFLTLAAWLGWLRRPGTGRYLFAVSLFALALLAKPMAVTLPFALLLIDWWPLGRWRGGNGAGTLAAPPRLALEKAPLFLLAAASSWITWVAQQRGGSVVQAEWIPFTRRAANAVVSYGRYAAEMLWPTGLAPFYPYPAHSWSRLVPWEAAFAGLAILAATAAALAAARRVPCLAAGWLWYLGTLVPVIGLVQVGGQSHADRYTYIPLVGLFILVAFGSAALAPARASARPLGIAALLVLAALAAATRAQLGVWRDSVTLFERVLLAGPDDERAPGISSVHLNLGALLMERGRAAEAARHFLLAARGRPDLWKARYNLGNAYGALGRSREAESEYREAIRIDATAAPPWNNLGALLYTSGRIAEAAAAYAEALRLNPDYAEAHFNLGLLLSGQGRAGEAVARYREALRLQPDYPDARRELERLQQGR
jgi:protein O-mannosyl-transferase